MRCWGGREPAAGPGVVPEVAATGAGHGERRVWCWPRGLPARGL